MNQPEERHDNRILTQRDVEEIPRWLRHFFIYAVKPMATTLVGWIDQMKVLSRKNESGNH